MFEEMMERARMEAENYYKTKIEQLTSSNKQLSSSNKQLSSSNEQLSSSVEQLISQVDYLKSLLKQHNIQFN